MFSRYGPIICRICKNRKSQEIINLYIWLDIVRNKNIHLNFFASILSRNLFFQMIKVILMTITLTIKMIIVIMMEIAIMIIMMLIIMLIMISMIATVMIKKKVMTKMIMMKMIREWILKLFYTYSWRVLESYFRLWPDLSLFFLCFHYLAVILLHFWNLQFKWLCMRLFRK